MKKFIAMLLSLIVIAQMMIIVNVEASVDTLDWTLSSIELEHKSVSFRISGVETAQQAVLNITSEDGLTNIDIPFQINSSTEDVVLEIPENMFLATDATSWYAVNYFLTVSDLLGNKTSKYKQGMWLCNYYLLATAYPEMLIASSTNSSSITEINVTVGFKKYSATRTEEGSLIVDYPKQEIGTLLEVEYGDAYGCIEKETYTVQNESLYLPEIYVWRDSVTAYYSSLEDDERLVVDINGRQYYSNYGLKGGKIQNNYITYPIIDKSISLVNVWVESTNGSKSDVKEIEIQNCRFVDTCEEGINFTSYSTKTVGSTLKNEYGRGATKVSTQIMGQTYSCSVDENGEFELAYPEMQIGDVITLVLEDNDGCFCSLDSVIGQRLYDITTHARTKSMVGKIDNYYWEDDYVLEGCSLHVIAGGEKYDCTLERRDSNTNELFDPNQYVEDGIEITEDDYYYYFSVTYPKQKVGSKIQLVIVDSDGIISREDITLKNIAPKLSIDKVDSSSKMIKGRSVAGAKYSIKIGKKKYSGKVKSNGRFSVKIKQYKEGTKGRVSVTTSEGYKKTKTFRVQRAYGYVALNRYVYKSSSKVGVVVYHGKKRDKLKVSIGGKTYNAKLKRNISGKCVWLNIAKPKAGAKIKIYLYDKFGKKKSMYNGMVYYSDRIYKGMSAKNATLTTWGSPIRRNDWGTGEEQWIYQIGVTTVYVYIRNGIVSNIQKINF